LMVLHPSKRRSMRRPRSRCRKNSQRLIRANKRLTALNGFWKNAIMRSCTLRRKTEWSRRATMTSSKRWSSRVAKTIGLGNRWLTLRLLWTTCMFRERETGIYRSKLIHSSWTTRSY
jgi:hypothetical protein